MHCEGCARRVRRSLTGFEGVEDLKTDCKSHTVVVKGKTADPVKVCKRIQRKTRRKTGIISPLPKPLEEEKKEDDKDKSEEKKDEPPPVITVILNVRMNCEACAQVLQKRSRKIDGVESVETDMKNEQVIVKGVVDPAELVQKVYKRTGKLASVVKDEEKKEEEKKEEEKKDEKVEEENKGEESKVEDNKLDNVKKSEYWPPRYYVEYIYPPEVFSDENPHACSIM